MSGCPVYTTPLSGCRGEHRAPSCPVLIWFASVVFVPAGVTQFFPLPTANSHPRNRSDLRFWWEKRVFFPTKGSTPLWWGNLWSKALAFPITSTDVVFDRCAEGTHTCRSYSKASYCCTVGHQPGYPRYPLKGFGYLEIPPISASYLMAM